MIENPDKKLDFIPFSNGDIVSVHVETTKHLQRALTEIKKRGGKPFVAINPATPLTAIEEVLFDIDGVLLMTVNPGFAGQKLIPSTIEKIAKLKNLIKASGTNIEIEVDGNVSFENAVKMSNAGADIFVAGTSSVFTGDMEKGIEKLRESIK
jgi:ribulose-phosphate 3-epimerase